MHIALVCASSAAAGVRQRLRPSLQTPALCSAASLLAQRRCERTRRMARMAAVRPLPRRPAPRSFGSGSLL
eukprot:365526-Chlamydomonas_euryale.AAC.9